MSFWRSVVGKLWMTIIGLVACVLLTLGFYLIPYIDSNFTHPNDIKRLFVFVAIIGFSLTTFFAFFLFTKITQPLRQLKKAAERIRTGDYTTRVESKSSDELGELSTTFNHMAEELNQTIRDLHQEKEQLSSILRSMTDAVITFDASGKVLVANPQGQSNLEKWSKLGWADADEHQARSEVPEPLRPLFDQARHEATEVVGRVLVEQEVWSVAMGPLYNDNRVRGAVAVLRDITEEFRMEKLRSDFIANVSHEIRTPLSMMQGYSEALLDDIVTSPEERQELVQVIHDESLRMGRLVKDLLDLARIEAGHMQMQFQELDINELIQRMVRKYMVISKEKDIPIYADCQANPSLLKMADVDRLEQVLTNLLDNAIRHSQAGESIVIHTELKSENDGDWIWIRVQDHGQGIPKEDLPYIFERFYKADKARTRGANAGTGLGLAIVKNIVDAHHGVIQVKSALGDGATFLLKLPVEGTQK